MPPGCHHIYAMHDQIMFKHPESQEMQTVQINITQTTQKDSKSLLCSLWITASIQAQGAATTYRYKTINVLCISIM